MNFSFSDIDIERLFEKPLWQMTGREFCALSQYANSQGGQKTSSPAVVRIAGVKALAEYMDCSESAVYDLKRRGVLNDAVIPTVGRKIVFDGDKARALAAKYKEGNFYNE